MYNDTNNGSNLPNNTNNSNNMPNNSNNGMNSSSTNPNGYNMNYTNNSNNGMNSSSTNSNGYNMNYTNNSNNGMNSSSTNPNEYDMNYTNNSNNKGNNKLFITITVIALIIIGILIAGYFILGINNPKKVFEKTISNVQKQLNNFVDVNINKDLNSLSMNNQISFNTNNDKLISLNDVKINFNYNIDYNAKYISLNTKYTEKNKDILNIDGYLNDNDIFVDLHNLYTKKLFLEMPEEYKSKIEEIFKDSNNSTKDMLYILDKSLEYTKKSLDKDDFNKYSDKININGKEISVTANELKINTTFINKFKNNFINNILNDEEYLDILIKYSEVDKNDFIDDLKHELDEEYNEDININIIMYTKGKNLVGIKIIEDNIEFLNYTNKDNISKLKLSTDKSELVLEHKKIDKENSTLKISALANKIEEEIKFNINKKEFSKNKYDYIITFEKVFEEDILLKFKYDYNNVDKDNSQQKINIKISKDNKFVELNQLSNIATNNNIKIETLNKNDAKNINSLSKYEFNKIKRNLENNLRGTLIENLFTNLNY